MTLMEAAKKWSISPNWVRELIKSKRLPAKLMTDGPVPYYAIPDGTPKPGSMQRAPFRKGTTKKVKEASIKRRVYRATKEAPVKKRAEKKAAAKK
jgi:hypothetical protein